VKNDRRIIVKDEPSTSNIKIDSLAKNMERIMDRLDNMKRKPQWDNQ